MKHIKLFEAYPYHTNEPENELKGALSKSMMNPEMSKPIMVIGNPEINGVAGTDATSLVFKIAKEMGAKVYLIDSEFLTPKDFESLEMDGNMSTNLMLPSGEEKSVVIFSGVDRASDPVFEIILKFSNERYYGNYELPDQSVVVVISEETDSEISELFPDRYQIIDFNLQLTITTYKPQVS